MKVITSVIVMVIVACSVEAQIKASFDNGTATLQIDGGGLLRTIFNLLSNQNNGPDSSSDGQTQGSVTASAGGQGDIGTTGPNVNVDGGVSIGVNGGINGSTGGMGSGRRLISELMKLPGSGLKLISGLTKLPEKLISGLMKFLGSGGEGGLMKGLSGPRGLLGGILKFARSEKSLNASGGVEVNGGVSGSAKSGLITGLMNILGSKSGPLKGLMDIIGSKNGPLKGLMNILGSKNGPLKGLMNILGSKSGPLKGLMDLIKSIGKGGISGLAKLISGDSMNGGVTGSAKSGLINGLMALVNSTTKPVKGLIDIITSKKGPLKGLMDLLRSDGKGAMLSGLSGKGGFLSGNGSMALTGTLNKLTSGLFQQIMNILNKALKPVFKILSILTSNIVSPQLIHRLTSGALGSPNSTGTMSGSSIPGVHIRFDARVGDRNRASFNVGGGRRRNGSTNTTVTADAS